MLDTVLYTFVIGIVIYAVFGIVKSLVKAIVIVAAVLAAVLFIRSLFSPVHVASYEIDRMQIHKR